jgi:antitoxin ParD1/3/4
MGIMNVELTPALEDLVREKVESGLYRDASEVVREALRLLDRQDRIVDEHLAGFRDEIEQARRSVAEGRSEVYETEEEFRAAFDRL